MSESTSNPRASRRRVVVAASVALAGLTAAGVSIADAAFASTSHHSAKASKAALSSSSSKPAVPKPPAADGADFHGTITSISADSLTVRDIFGTARTFALTDSTTVHQGKTSASASSLATGQRVNVRATKSGSTYTATSIDIQLAHIDGSVTAVDGNAVTVTDPDGFTRSIQLSSSTTFTKDGNSADSSDVAVGSVVHAEGTVDGDGTTLDASSVDIRTKASVRQGPGGMPGPGGPGPGGPGPGGPGPGGPGPGGKGGSAGPGGQGGPGGGQGGPAKGSAPSGASSPSSTSS